MGSVVRGVAAGLGGVLRTIGRVMINTGFNVSSRHPLYRSSYCRQTRLVKGRGKWNLQKDTFIAPNATVIGNVKIGQSSSVWYGAVLNGDLNDIEIGEKTEIGNRAIISEYNFDSKQQKVKIGSGVIIGEGAILQGCTVEDDCKIEAGAIIMQGAKVSSNSIVGPGAVVAPNTIIPGMSYFAGNPAEKVRDISEKEKLDIREQREVYYKMAKIQEREELKSPHDQELQKELWEWHLADPMHHVPRLE
eukprot:TRINITY_DN10246_c0_g1_i1.p1 TRINITY_DN10246_c0_g1~~TRINITY_DN10246_c0_g1_i1.p1  ORF type:complete len:256 (-),score=50.74 TRINITY_DN10246_c0_g1_i1:64-804(-)